MSEGFKNTAKAIEWRRSIVLDRLAMGQTQEAFARELHLHPSTISLDVQHLRTQARQEVKDFIKELPLMVKQSTRALNLIFVKTLEQIERQKIELYTNMDVLDSFVEAVEKRSEEQEQNPEPNQEQSGETSFTKQEQTDEEETSVVEEDNE